MSWKEILKKEEPIKKSPAILNRLPENLKQKVRDFNSAISQYKNIYGMDAIIAPTER